MDDINNKIIEKHKKDKEQLHFILSNKSHIVVTAPAGCGKTTAMISKVLYELSSENILKNKKVLVLTFSVNATKRIKDSLKELLPKFVNNSDSFLDRIDVANFHSFAMRLLYKYGFIVNKNLVNFSKFKITDDSSIIENELKSSLDIAKFKKIDEAIKNYNLEIFNNNIKNYLEIISNKLLNKNIITYNGILILAIQLLSNNNISHFYSNYYQMIIIDEFQDTNLLGWLLIEKLINDNKVIFMGDNIQKIYGFLGAIDNIIMLASKKFDAEMISFKNNYRFNNNNMKQVDLLIRNYAEYYKPLKMSATLFLKELKSDFEEVKFISEGIKKVLKTNNSVAILVRAGWHGDILVDELRKNNIPFFNSLYSESDIEYTNFYNIAIEEFHNKVAGNATQRMLNKCLSAIKIREKEIYLDFNKKYIFESMFKLLEKLFEISKTWEMTIEERYFNINFELMNYRLKHMMEYLDERVIITTIHSSKGLEWDYVIIPQMNASIFPSYKYICKICYKQNGCKIVDNYCYNNFISSMEKNIKEELNIFYVAFTRAKKGVFLTANTGKNKFGYDNQISCIVNLPGLKHLDYEWEEYIY